MTCCVTYYFMCVLYYDHVLHRSSCFDALTFAEAVIRLTRLFIAAVCTLRLLFIYGLEGGVLSVVIPISRACILFTFLLSVCPEMWCKHLESSQPSLGDQLPHGRSMKSSPQATDCLFRIGTRQGRIAWGDYGFKSPENTLPFIKPRNVGND